MDYRKSQEAAFNPYSAPEDLEVLPELEETPSDTEAIRNKFLKHEASIQSVGYLYYLSALLVFIGAGYFIFLAMDPPLAPNGETIVALPVFLAGFYLACTCLFIWIGNGLRGLKNWARITSGILAIPGLIGIPIGTLISAIILYLMFSKKGAYICTDEYKQVIAATPHIRYRTSIIVKIAAALLLVVIGLGLVGLLFSPRQ